MNKPCKCGCGKVARGDAEYNSDCKVECACGCGGRARYAYAPGHRPMVTCSRCPKTFSPTKSEFTMCSQCRRHVKAGRPIEKNAKLVSSRKMQAASPEGKRWCSGCKKYRAVKFFGLQKSGPYSRCKPCFKKQQHASRVARQYNITPEQYDEIKQSQGGKCAICQVATGATKSLAVDHDHRCCPAGGSCGQCVRGTLCSPCNKMLGFGRDDPEFFLRAVEYLKNPPAHSVVPRTGKVKP